MTATPPADYLHVIRHTSLCSIDLLLQNTSGKYLLGWRNNSPAKNTWFFPGGRIFKYETHKDAIARISQKELGIALHDYVPFGGVFRHVYPDNFVNSEFGTEYISFPYIFQVKDFDIVADSQHSEFIWLSKEEILNHKDVHENTKKFLMDNPDNKII